jgi:hypothetical protein
MIKKLTVDDALKVAAVHCTPADFSTGESPTRECCHLLATEVQRLRARQVQTQKVLEELAEWNAATGGWEAPVWKQVTRLRAQINRLP